MGHQDVQELDLWEGDAFPNQTLPLKSYGAMVNSGARFVVTRNTATR